MPKAELVLREKVCTADGIIVEFRVWRVSRSAQYPDGFRYSFVAVRNGIVLVGYDNHAPKGHHRHLGGKQERYEFESLDKLRADFMKDVESARRARKEGE